MFFRDFHTRSLLFQNELPQAAFGFFHTLTEHTGSNLDEDQSSEHIHSGALFDATMVLGDTFDMLEVPYAVRVFGSHAVQIISMGDATFAPYRAASLAESNLGGTRMADTAGLAQAALQACPERNRIFGSLTDGALNDHEQSWEALADARKNGIVTFGIFLGDSADMERMDQLYACGSWTTIQSLTDMPKAVGQRLASIFKSLR